MRVPVSWLADLVEVPESVDELAEMITAMGLKVEGIEAPGKALQGVIVAKVLEIHPHPNADRIRLVDVDDGSPAPRRIVCGAWNFEVGDRVPLATPGVRLPNGMEITAAKIRGEVSEGMLCSAKELGVAEDAAGLLVLPGDPEPGSPVAAALGADDVVLDLEITPNRPDLMSLIGVAREVAAVTRQKIRMPSPSFQEGATPVTDLTSVETQDSEGCPRYLARVITGVSVGPSPEWVQRRLVLAGLRPVSNVVDATNYALLVSGHPLHGFDLDKLKERRIVVRRAATGEEIVTIDGDKRKLDAGDLVIADGSRPVAIAGVMGGADTEVSNETTTVLLESAHFDPRSIMRTSRHHGLRSEASARYERGTDPNNVQFASDLACSLIVEWAGGEIAAGGIDIYPDPVGSRRVALRTERARLLTGIDYADEEIADALDRLGLTPQAEGDVIVVHAPTRRQDIRIEEDLIEEVARTLGYDRVPSHLPSSRSRAGKLTSEQTAVRRIRTVLAGAGLFEALTSSMIGPADLAELGFDEGEVPALEIAHPLIVDESLMRPSLVPGLVAAVRRNLSRRNLDVRLFEIGPCFIPSGKALPHEPLRLGLVMCGTREATWNRSETQVDFYDLKGVVELLLESLQIDGAEFVPAAQNPYHPTRAARVEVSGRVLGWMGQLSEEASRSIDVTAGCFAAEFDVDALLAVSGTPAPPADPGKFPAVFLDIAVAVDETVSAGALMSVLREAGGPELEAARIFDVYRGEQVGEGRRSIAIALTFRSPGRTLTEQEAITRRDAIAAALREQFRAELRAG